MTYNNQLIRNILTLFSIAILFHSSTESSSGALPVTSGLVLHLESDVDVTLGSGSTVTGWLDASGFDYDLSAAGDPQLVASVTPGGEPAIVFDGTGDKLERTGGLMDFPANGDDRTVFLVANYVDAQGVFSGASYGKGNFNRAFGVVADGVSGNLAVQGWKSANDMITTIAGVGDGWKLQSVVLSGNDLEHYESGLSIGSGTHSYLTRVDAPQSKIVIGEEISGAGFSQLEVSAYLIYDRALNETERQQVESYLDDKYFQSVPGTPVAVNDLASTTPGGTAVIDVVANDTDSDGTIDPMTVSIVSSPSNAASFTVNPTTGVVTYVNDGSGLPDSFTYTVDDNLGNTSNVAMVTIGADPVANDDSAPVELGGTAFVDVVSNDTDAGASIDPATVTIVSPPSNALSITVHPTTGVITYVNDGVTLPDTFTYTVDDFDGNTSNVATVTITESSSGVLPVTSGLVLHLESDVDVTLGSGSTVTGWLDASGFDYDLSAAGDPQLVASATPGGEPAIVFDGTGDKLERVGNSALLTLPRNSEDRTVFAVVNHVDTQGVNSGPVYGKSSSNRAFGLVADASDSGQLAVEGFGAAKQPRFDDVRRRCRLACTFGCTRSWNGPRPLC